MPKGTSIRAHSDAKQFTRQMTDFYGGSQAEGVSSALVADLAITFTMPDSLSQAVGYFTGTKTFKIQVKDSDGIIQKWYTDTDPTPTLTATTAGDGNATVTSCSVVNGEGTLTIDITGTWATSDTLQISPASQFNFSGSGLIPTGCFPQNGAGLTLTVS